MRPVNHERGVTDLRNTPVRLGPGSSAEPVEGFAWAPEMLRAYSAAVTAYGTDHRPRTGGRPTEHAGTPGPQTP